MPLDAVAAVVGRPDRDHQSEAGRDGGRMVRSRAPLRLGLAGGGTDVSPYCDYFGGLVLNATIDRYCYATVEERMDGRTRFDAADVGVTGDLRDGDSRLQLHQAVYRRLDAEYRLGSPALTVTTAADAPSGSGLGSSSTLVVALVEAFREYFSLPLGEYDVARLAYDIERKDCRLEGGRQDQYAATFGGFNVMEFAAHERVVVNPLRLKPAVVHELEASLVLFYTGASRSSGEIIERQAAAVSAGDAERVEASHALKQEVIEMKEALFRGELGIFTDVLRRGWEAKKKLADGITTWPIERLFDAALAGGALAGKVSGAGGGGFVMFLVDPSRRPALVRTLHRYEGGHVENVHFVDDGAVAWVVR